MSRRCGLAAAAIALSLATALALPAHALAAKAPVANGHLELQAWTEDDTLVLVVSVQIPSTVKLPATVRIPVPADGEVQWAGEILGGDPSADPSRAYKLKNSPAGGRYAEFTVETTRVAQVDAFLPIVTTSGSNVSAAFDWIQSVSSPSTTFSLRAPAKASSVKLTPKPSSAPEFNSAGEALYSGDAIVLAPGSKTRVSLAYSTAPNAGAAAPANAGSKMSFLYFLVAALLVAIGVLAVVLLKQRMATVSRDDEDD